LDSECISFNLKGLGTLFAGGLSPSKPPRGDGIELQQSLGLVGTSCQLKALCEG